MRVLFWSRRRRRRSYWPSLLVQSSGIWKETRMMFYRDKSCRPIRFVSAAFRSCQL